MLGLSGIRSTGAVGEIAPRLLSEVGYYPPPLQSYLDLVWRDVLHVLDWCMYMYEMYGYNSLIYINLFIYFDHINV